ncbi:sn-glycerol-3-phosphate ABC transporter ATP-binding protein UgpC [Clostridium botulinum]|uniref:ABC transporter ATP-binding protein n=1 Tax=Clostridium botulinum TaxID=1491 RepID=UPI00052C7E8D|nr:sn-glycerol-3-phosphate ABC transporter ATP-binding protein UgpC [Clostridium botulinum]KGM98221.1 sugar ABC transporter ATP-binding protein [Clostridium botulinum D str. CCUG 7971]KOC50430.1 sugar ABC transporter ATP-binding protein [Clostridium botulinum]NFO97036.1 sn-glycerol-3-phosphate ABC transporter ATP-binding protein UgpC [Clostridium botulinum]OOV51167.1 ABC transporter ATP-binding protein [Clostridium botulinum D/C]OOV56270.1 ABC transporter ATP-binding protein [Clostridium botul
MAKVVLKDVEKVYPNGFKAVHGINLEINDGEFMVFVGPSGCAKSTTLRMIAGLEEISSGTISIGDRVVNDIAPKNREIAMVFQNYALYPHMSVYDNMAFSLKIRKISKDIIDKKVREAAKNLDLEEVLKRKPKELSGGQRQRVAVGRAIVRDPKVFLFDEPLSNLDAKLRVHMRVQLSKLHKELKTTMIYVTHDQVEAMTMGDRICVMNFGKIMQVDTPLNLYNHPVNKFVAEFIGSPSMNVIEGHLVKKDNITLLKVGSTELRLPENKANKVKDYIGKKVWFGIRPEDINLEENDNNAMVPGVVDFVENMGNESFTYFELGGKQFISNIQSSKIIDMKTGDKVKFMFNMDNCHIFDIDSEENITL